MMELPPNLVRKADALISNSLHQAKVFDSLDEGCGLTMPLNNPDNGETHAVALLEIEDAGIAPDLWSFALDVLRHRVAQQRRLIPHPDQPQKE